LDFPTPAIGRFLIERSRPSALLATASEIKGHSYQEAFVRSPFAALISIHSALSASSHGDAVFFLCADEATSEASPKN